MLKSFFAGAVLVSVSSYAFAAQRIVEVNVFRNNDHLVISDEGELEYTGPKCKIEKDLNPEIFNTLKAEINSIEESTYDSNGPFMDFGYSYNVWRSDGKEFVIANYQNANFRTLRNPFAKAVLKKLKSYISKAAEACESLDKR